MRDGSHAWRTVPEIIASFEEDPVTEWRRPLVDMLYGLVDDDLSSVETAYGYGASIGLASATRPDLASAMRIDRDIPDSTCEAETRDASAFCGRHELELEIETRPRARVAWIT